MDCGLRNVKIHTIDTWFRHCLFLFFVVVSNPATGNGIGVTTPSSLNVRSEPNGIVIDSLPQYTAVFSINEVDGWRYISYAKNENYSDMKRGWVSDRYIYFKDTPSIGAASAAVTGDNCKRESKSGASACVVTTNIDFDCNEHYNGGYYDRCEVDIDYTVKSNYQGDSSLRVYVECEAELQLDGGNSYYRSVSESDSKSHTVYSSSTKYENVDLDFSFYYDEPASVSVEEVDCSIERITLY